MLFKKWEQRIASSRLLTTGDGRTVFYPFGPLKGYVLPKSAFKPLIIKMFVSFTFFAIATGALLFIVGLNFNLSMELLLLIGLLDFIPYYFGVRRLTRKMVKLPCYLSMLVYASQQDPEQIKILFGRKLIFLIMLAFFTVVGPQPAFGCILAAWISASTVTTFYLIYLQSHELNTNSHEAS